VDNTHACSGTIAEVELADLALALQVEIEIVSRLPCQRHETLGTHEFARLAIGARLHQF
jgi:hypothetical protein